MNAQLVGGSLVSLLVLEACAREICVIPNARESEICFTWNVLMTLHLNFIRDYARAGSTIMFKVKKETMLSLCIFRSIYK